jgi:hypothetical protein
VATHMMISEIEEECARLRSEFGDAEAVIPDQLEPAWVNGITHIEFDADSQRVVFTAD